jgi:hypothetical protein
MNLLIMHFVCTSHEFCRTRISLTFVSIEVSRKQRNVRATVTGVYCTSLLEENAVCVWPEDQYISRNAIKNCQLTRCHNMECCSMHFHRCVKTSNLNKEMFCVNYCFFFNFP